MHRQLMPLLGGLFVLVLATGPAFGQAGPQNKNKAIDPDITRIIGDMRQGKTLNPDDWKKVQAFNPMVLAKNQQVDFVKLLADQATRQQEMPRILGDLKNSKILSPQDWKSAQDY